MLDYQAVIRGKESIDFFTRIVSVDFFFVKAARNAEQLRKQNARRRDEIAFAPLVGSGARRVFARQRFGEIEQSLLRALIGAKGAQTRFADFARAVQRRAAAVRAQGGHRLRLRRDFFGIDDESRGGIRIPTQPVFDGFAIAVDARVVNLQIFPFGQGANVVTLADGARFAFGFFERRVSKRHAENGRDFLAHKRLAVRGFGGIVVAAAQAAPDDLLAKQLRHKRAQADNVGDGVAIPALGEHADAHDATHGAPRRSDRTAEFSRQFHETVGIYLAPGAVARPFVFADGVESPAHPARLVRFAAAFDLFGDFRIDANRALLAVLISQIVQGGGGDSRRLLVFGQPFVNDFRQFDVFANNNKNRRARVGGIVALPLALRFFAHPAQHCDGGVGVSQNRLDIGLAAFAASLAGGEFFQNPIPNVQITRNVRAGRVAHGHLRDFDQPRFDGVVKVEVADRPRKNLARVFAGGEQVIRRRRKIDAKIDSARFLDSVEAIDPHRRLFAVGAIGFVVADEVAVFVAVYSQAIGVMRLVVDDEDILFAAEIAPQNAAHDGGVAFDIFFGFDDGGFQIAFVVEFFTNHAQNAERFFGAVIVERQPAFALRHRGFFADMRDFAHDNAPSGF